MAEITKLSTLLDDPQARVVVFGLAHVDAAGPTAAGAPRLRAVVAQLAETTDPDQYRSWLADDVPNGRMTVDQVRAALGDDTIDDVARFAGGSPDELAWQLAVVLPDLVDALSPGGVVIEADELGEGLRAAAAAGDRSAGPFGSRAH